MIELRRPLSRLAAVLLVLLYILAHLLAYAMPSVVVLTFLTLCIVSGLVSAALYTLGDGQEARGEACFQGRWL